MFSHVDLPAAKAASASKGVAASLAAAKPDGAVRKTVDKIHKDAAAQRSMREKILAQAARNVKRTSGMPQEGANSGMGFPQIGEDPEEY